MHTALLQKPAAGAALLATAGRAVFCHRSERRAVAGE